MIERSSQLNCCMHDGLKASALKGRLNLEGSRGGLNRSGGDTAKGMPKNWSTSTLASGRAVVVPTTVPWSIVADGDC